MVGIATQSLVSLILGDRVAKLIMAWLREWSIAKQCAVHFDTSHCQRSVTSSILGQALRSLHPTAD
jgi:uncharacterized membrane protein